MGGLLHLVQRGGAWEGWGPAQSPSRCTKCNSPPINGQCTNLGGDLSTYFDGCLPGANLELPELIVVIILSNHLVHLILYNVIFLTKT